MKNQKQNEYVARESILKLLSDDEVATVSTAETAAHLTDGDEYLDLEQLARGVLKASTKIATPMGRILAKKSVHKDTWEKILADLSAHSAV